MLLRSPRLAPGACHNRAALTELTEISCQSLQSCPHWHIVSMVSNAPCGCSRESHSLPLAHDAWLGFVCKSGPHFVDKRDAVGVVGSVKDDSRRYRSPAQHGWSTSGAKNVNVATSSNPNGPGASSPSSTSCVLLWQGLTRVHPIKGCKVVHTVIAWLCKTQGASPSMPGASMLPLMVDKPSSAMIRPIPLSWSVARPARASVVVGPLASRLE
ncbi:hypothetical protein MSAN_02528500 [Mycena sanguinolenta]|uniref:Uncharacterized protein n=1 Tax=Mycena sanguinolenta TaxID=230812 RepID=A0A8H6WMN8_9AGAR|nr:hypothetical protein MSAN_02528500 [Mycena sanguinolenta]